MEDKDRAWWMPSTKGNFREIQRPKKQKRWFWKKFWVKGLPMKIFFFIWRLWNLKLPIDDIVASWGV